MAKKKVQYPNKLRNNIVTAAVSTALIAVLILLVGLNIAERNYVFAFNGEKISPKDYKVYLYQQKLMYESYFGSDYWGMEWSEDGSTLAEYATQAALNSLFQQRLAMKHFDEKGLSLSDEQKETAKQTRDDILESFSKNMLAEIGLSDKGLLEFMENDMKLSILYDEMTKDFEVDEEDFEEYYEQYLIDNEKSLTTVNVNYILTDSRERAEEALERAKGGEDIYSLIKEFSIDYTEPEPNEDGEIEDFRMSPSAATSVYELDSVIDTIYSMQEGEFSEIFEIEDDTVTEEGSEETAEEDETPEPITQYIFVKIDNIVLPDYDELKETVRETYTTEKKDEIFAPIFEEWASEITIEYNEEVINRINIMYLPV